ncbi:hypothetical protein ABQF31_29015 [Mycobacterium syngnathidarum]
MGRLAEPLSIEGWGDRLAASFDFSVPLLSLRLTRGSSSAVDLVKFAFVLGFGVDELPGLDVSDLVAASRDVDGRPDDGDDDESSAAATPVAKEVISHPDTASPP